MERCSRALEAEHYNHFRDYDSALARYLESDPIGLSGGLSPIHATSIA